MSRHYKLSKGLLSHEEIDRILSRMTVLPSIARGIREYFVDGKTIKQLKVNTSMLIPYMREAHQHYLSTNLDDHRHRFLYTNDFNPSMRGAL